MIDAFLNAKHVFQYEIKLPRRHRQAAGVYLARIGCRKNRDYMRQRERLSDGTIVNKDLYIFRRSENAVALKFWEPPKPALVEREQAFYYAPYIPLHTFNYSALNVSNVACKVVQIP